MLVVVNYELKNLLHHNGGTGCVTSARLRYQTGTRSGKGLNDHGVLKVASHHTIVTRGSTAVPRTI